MPVKGPRLHRMVVVPYRPGLRWFGWTTVLALCVLVAVAAFFAGRFLAMRELAGDAADFGTVSSLERLLAENATLRNELAVYRGSGEVTREVEERVRVDNRQLQDRIAELEKALADYRRLAIPDRAGKGLRIERMELASAGAGQGWLLRLVMVRTGDTDGAVEGSLDGRLLADGPAGRVELPLAQLVTAERRAFRVRYVDERMLELRLPPGTTPVRLDLVAGITAPRTDRIEKSWQRQVSKPQEVPGNVGQE